MPGSGRPGRRLAGGAVLAAGLAAVLLSASMATAGATARPGRPSATVDGSLQAVSCTSAKNCMAAGGLSVSPGGTLTERWNGTTWSVVPMPTTSDGQLNGIACSSARNCIAVGSTFEDGHSQALAEQWNGTKWSFLPVVIPSETIGSDLESIACTSSSNCQAVGYFGNDTLAEGWNGTAWSIESSPSPHPSRPDDLSGVACPSASLCWAVGYDFPTNFTGSLTEKWNGTKWSVVHTPNSSAGELIGDACSGTADCVSAGIGNSLFAIGQLWNGTTWARAAPKKPAGATGTELNGVSCPAGGAACESTGDFSTSSATGPLAEGWNGTAWALQSTPAISGSTYATLEGVSCTTSSNCWSVGVSDTSSGSDPLIEEWNGTTWSVTAS